MKADALGLYLHIPFCLKKCSYCDFCSHAGATREEMREYTDALIGEANSYKRDERIAVDTVFFGGGTPTILPQDDFLRIMSALRECFDISDTAEITVEANPKTLTSEKLRVYRECGVNRISIGLQSIHGREQRALGRVHNYEDFLESFRLARDGGIDNINVDIMYAIPEQTEKSLSETLDRVIALSPEHISAYSLIIEEGTPFYERRDALPLPDEDAECEMYTLITRRLRDAGYTHYEISNYAKAERECRHNLIYWTMHDYIGLGLNAHSYFEGARYFNTDCMEKYLSPRRDAFRTVHPVDFDEREYEYCMLALRLGEGIDLSEYREAFRKDFREGREATISRLEGIGLVKDDGGRIFLTEKGFYVSNSIITELI